MPVQRLASLGLLMLSIAHPLAAQPGRESDASRLRTLYLQRDYETGVMEGAKLVVADPNSSELKAWFVLHKSRRSEEDEAVAMARQMTASRPQDAWCWFALAGALNGKGGYAAESIEATGKALAILPDHPDMIWMRAQSLAADPPRRDDALAFIESQKSRVKNPAMLLGTRGYLLYVQGSATPRDEAKLKASFDSFDEARRVDPTYTNAFYLPATYLDRLRRTDEAIPLLKTALTLAPGSTEVHQAYWNAVRTSKEIPADKKREIIEADMTAFLEKHGGRPGPFWAVASVSRDMKLSDRQRDAEEQIMKRFSDSREAEWVLAYRWRGYGETKEGHASPEYRKTLTDYINRPKHYHLGLLGEAYRNLFFVVAEDKTASDQELSRLAAGMVKYENNNPHIVFVRGPIVLADRKVLLKDAERIARDGLDVLKKKVESQRSMYKGEGEYERGMHWMTAMGHDALGWVLLAQGRTDDGEKELLRSHELDRESRENLHHLGRFYELKGDTAKAEEYYVKGLAVQSPGTNPSEASLKALYEKKTGGTAGYDEYLTKLRDSDRERRKERVLTARIASPAAPQAFNLKSIDGKRVTLDSLKGKIVVINFWGIWCGWCVKEMPDIQKLHEKYASDPDVAILTIDNDKNPDDVAPWMKEKKYTFGVLFDDGYVDKVGIHSFPTTWFLDQSGRKVFEKEGWSEKLLEEFTWRVEAIRGAPR